MAEDLAIEDTMEVLAKALDHEQLSLDIFLKVAYPPSINRLILGNAQTSEGTVSD